MPSVAQLGRSTRVIVPRGLGRLLEKRRFSHVTEVDVGQEVEIGSLRVRATHADHDGGRGPLGARAASLGFVVTGTRSVYFAGDTDLFPEMAEIGPVDIALLPVSGWGPNLPPGHLDPRRAAGGAGAAAARHRDPDPLGHVARAQPAAGPEPAPPETPAESFVRHAAELAPDVTVHLLLPGEALAL